MYCYAWDCFFYGDSLFIYHSYVTMNNTGEDICYENESFIALNIKIEVIVVSPTTWETHHNSKLLRSLVTERWLKSMYWFFLLWWNRLMTNKQMLLK